MLLPPILASLPLPIVGAPLFIVSNPKLVIAQCTGHGFTPANGAQRCVEQFEECVARANGERSSVRF